MQEILHLLMIRLGLHLASLSSAVNLSHALTRVELFQIYTSVRVSILTVHVY